MITIGQVEIGFYRSSLAIKVGETFSPAFHAKSPENKLPVTEILDYLNESKYSLPKRMLVGTPYSTDREGLLELKAVLMKAGIGLIVLGIADQIDGGIAGDPQIHSIGYVYDRVLNIPYNELIFSLEGKDLRKELKEAHDKLIRWASGYVSKHFMSGYLRSTVDVREFEVSEVVKAMSIEEASIFYFERKMQGINISSSTSG